MLQEILKSATARDHSKLERLMYVKDLIEGTLTLKQYMHLIYTNFLVHSLVEQKLFNSLHADAKARLNIGSREKVSALKKDFNTLGLDSVFMINELPEFEIENEAQALGALYVLEGATLGGQVISKMLQKNSAVNHLQGVFNYYNVYGNDLGKNWKLFCSFINNLPAEANDEVIAGSKKMYDCFKAIHTSVSPSAFTIPAGN